ncbi:response regulator [Thiovibrio frasassiensis]|jgi:CheY-like chemotaxis protein|uniref:Response regulator n=1 Tax=Thiovibrio frasassiensis TaxID=2984131 RepID=A0A9X4RP69_9BACT|nr:response regulator [Thiovibrio frasassiensis]MDG4474937.1 response regulator [Thiovibrio frasassiensis]
MLKTILIVDDSAMIRRIVSQLVQQLGHQSITAENGLLGFELAVKSQPDMIIMDIEMPIMGGFEATWKIKADHRTSHIPVAFFTALGSEESIVQAKEAGGIGFLNKPICREELSQAIHDIIGTA